ncbi:MAG: ribonucleotide reductase subunit alpha [Pseudomonadota bacterium]
MMISSYGELLAAARAQSLPQRLLFAFARAELPAGADFDQRTRFGAGRGGALEPVMCVDKSPADLGTFAQLVDESRHTGAHWDVVFVSSMDEPASVEAPLKRMVAAIQGGQLGNFLAFDRDGELLKFH